MKAKFLVFVGITIILFINQKVISDNGVDKSIREKYFIDHLYNLGYCNGCENKEKAIYKYKDVQNKDEMFNNISFLTFLGEVEEKSYDSSFNDTVQFIHWKGSIDGPFLSLAIFNDGRLYDMNNQTEIQKLVKDEKAWDLNLDSLLNFTKICLSIKYQLYFKDEVPRYVTKITKNDNTIYVEAKVLTTNVLKEEYWYSLTMIFQKDSLIWADYDETPFGGY